jgi:hypothetical protein
MYLCVRQRVRLAHASFYVGTLACSSSQVQGTVPQSSRKRQAPWQQQEDQREDHCAQGPVYMDCGGAERSVMQVGRMGKGMGRQMPLSSSQGIASHWLFPCLVRKQRDNTVQGLPLTAWGPYRSSPSFSRNGPRTQRHWLLPLCSETASPSKVRRGWLCLSSSIIMRHGSEV